MTACGAPTECLLDEFRASEGFPRTDGGTGRCQQPAAFDVLLWPDTEPTRVDLCAIHTVAASLHASRSTPRIRSAVALLPTPELSAEEAAIVARFESGPDGLAEDAL